MTRKVFFSVAAVAVMVLAVGVVGSWAGADATFATLATTVQDWLNGSLGRLLALVGVLVGLGSAMAGSFFGVLSGLGVAGAAYYLPQIVTNMATATL